MRWWQESELNPESQAAIAAEIKATASDDHIEVKITEISDVVRKPADISELELIKITAEEGKNIVLSGELPIEDEDFVVPFRRDDGRTLYFPISVKNGLFSATLNFPTSGRYQIDSQSLNSEFSTPRFTTKTLVVFVLRSASEMAESSTVNSSTTKSSATKSLMSSVLGK